MCFEFRIGVCGFEGSPSQIRALNPTSIYDDRGPPFPSKDVLVVPFCGLPVSLVTTARETNHCRPLV